MVLQFLHQTTFDPSHDEDKFQIWVQSLGFILDLPTSWQITHCHLCQNIPSLVYFNSSSHEYHFGLRFICSHCQVYWNVCSSCSTERQPIQFIRFRRRQMIDGMRLTIRSITTKLDEQLILHLSQHDSDVSSHEYVQDIEDDLTFEPTEVVEVVDERIVVEQIVNHTISEMFKDRIMSKFDEKLREALLERETNKKYPDYLIKNFLDK